MCLSERETVCDCVGGKKQYRIFQACLNMHWAVQVFSSCQQSTISVTLQKSHNQSAWYDWMTVSGLPSSWFTWNFSLNTQWSASIKTSSLDDRVNYSCIGQSRNTFPRNRFSPVIQLFLFNVKATWLSPSVFTASLLAFVVSFMRLCDIKLQSLRCGAGTVAIK